MSEFDNKASSDESPMEGGANVMAEIHFLLTEDDSGQRNT